MNLLDNLSLEAIDAGFSLYEGGPLTVPIDIEGRSCVQDGYDELFRRGFATLTLRGSSWTYALTDLASVEFARLGWSADGTCCHEGSFSLWIKKSGAGLCLSRL